MLNKWWMKADIMSRWFIFPNFERSSNNMKRLISKLQTVKQIEFILSKWNSLERIPCREIGISASVLQHPSYVSATNLKHFNVG
jgi:hypothetical protein